MRALFSLTFAVLVLVPSVSNGGCIKPVLHLSSEVKVNSWEWEAAFLDDLTVRLQSNPELRADVIIYGAQTCHRNEVAARLRLYNGYLVRSGRLRSDQVTIRSGGYRANSTVEIWLTTAASCPAPATPTVSSRDVVYLPGRYVLSTL